MIFCLSLPHYALGQTSDITEEDATVWDDEPLFVEEEGISVTASRQTSQQMAVIDKEQIEHSGAADIAVLLQETLNLNVTRYGTYGNTALINLRGLDSKRLAVLIDGVPANSSMDGRFDIEQIDLNAIERIEVIYGGSDTKYNVSGAMGGVINIITVKKQKPGLRLGASVSNTSALPGEYRDRNGTMQGPNWEDLLDTQNYSLSASYGGDHLSVSANAFANRAENHFLFTDRYDYTRRKDNNEVWDAGGSASLVREFADLTKLIASANFYYGDKNIPRSGFSSIVGAQQDIASRNNVMLDMPRAVHDDLATEASIGWHFIRMDYTAPQGATVPDTVSRHDQQNVTVINRWSWYSGENCILRSGFDYRFIYLDSTEIGDRNRHDGGIYLTAEYKPVDRLLIIPSVKAVFASEGATAVTAVPKLGFLWNVSDSLALRNNYFRSFKFPDFEELYWSGGGGVGNPDLKPEDGWGADIGAEWQIIKPLKLESVFFTHWLKDSIHWYSNGGIWRPENVGEAIFFGLDTKVRYEIPVSLGPIKKITPSLSYQYLLSYLLSFGYDFASGKKIPYSPEHTIGVSLEVAWGKGSAFISAHYENVRYNDRANLVELKPYLLLNATVNQKIGNNFSVFGALRNILNTSYESFYDYPMPGITLTLGMRFNIEIN